MAPPTKQPTEAQVYDMYDGLLEAMNHVILNTGDDHLRQLLQPLAQGLTNLLDDDDMLHLEANTAKFTALTPGMKTVNAALAGAQDKVNAVADKIADGGKVIAGLTTVLANAAKFV